MVSHVIQFVGVLSQVSHLSSQVITLADPTATSSITTDLAVGTMTGQSGGVVLPSIQVTHLVAESTQVLHCSAHGGQVAAPDSYVPLGQSQIG